MRRADVSQTYNKADIARYASAAPFLYRLKKLKRRLKSDDFRALRAMAIGGNVDGADRWLIEILSEQDIAGGKRP